MKFLFLCLGIITFWSCYDKVREKQADMTIARAETPLEKKNTKLTLPAYIKEAGGGPSKYNVFYVFDNSCSFCITKFIEVVQDFQMYKGTNFDNTRYYFIAINKDTSKIKYYLDKYKITLSKNQFLLPDKGNEFDKLNPGIAKAGETSYILADSACFPIVLEDPFYDFNSRDIYNSLGILKKHSGN